LSKTNGIESLLTIDGLGYGNENITCLRRFATGFIKSISNDSVASTIEKLARNVRRVFDYLRMTVNSRKIKLRCQSQEI
jgi:hypothetical protein